MPKTHIEVTEWVRGYKVIRVPNDPKDENLVGLGSFKSKKKAYERAHEIAAETGEEVR